MPTSIVLLEDLDPALFPGLIRHLPELKLYTALAARVLVSQLG
jgi:hypothetical protein